MRRRSAPKGPRRTSRRSSTFRTASSTTRSSRALAELRPEGEAGLVIARRVFGDGRTRAYAWGRAVAREDVAAAAERLIAMSGQFEQRRLARPSFQLDVLDAFCGAEQLERRREARLAWRELIAARRRYEELTRDADAVASRLAELQALVDATEGMAPGDEQELLARRERLRHVEELAEAANAAAGAIAPDEGEGAASLAALAERALAPLERIAPELGATAEELRDLTVRLREVGSDLHRFVASLDAEPGALEERGGASAGDRRPPAALRTRRRTTSCSSSRAPRSGSSERRPRAAIQSRPRASQSSRRRRRMTLPRRRAASSARGEQPATRRGRRGRARVARDGRGRVPRRAARARGRRGGRQTRRRSSSGRTPGSRSRRSRTRPPEASFRASPSRWRRSPEARPSSSTRSTQVSVE